MPRKKGQGPKFKYAEPQVFSYQTFDKQEKDDLTYHNPIFPNERILFTDRFTNRHQPESIAPDESPLERTHTDEGYISNDLSSTKATEEEDFDDTRSFASSMIQSPKSLDRRLRGSLDIKPILDLSEIGETDLHEEPTPIQERPEPLLEEPELENMEDDHKDTPIPSVKATPVTSRTGSPAPTSRSVAPSAKSSSQGSPAGSRSASPAPSLTKSWKSIEESSKGSSIASRAASPTPSIARSLAPSKTAEDHNIISDNDQVEKVPPECPEPSIIDDEGAGKDVNDAADPKEAEPTDVDIANEPEEIQGENEATGEVKEAVEANLDDTKRSSSTAEHESSEDQAPSVEILPESSMNDLESPPETVEENTVPDELQEVEVSSSAAAEPTESQVIQNEPETEDTDQPKSEDPVAEEPVIADSLANEAQDTNIAITVDADVDNSGAPVISEELEDNMTDCATQDDCEETKREEHDPVDTEVLLEDTIGETPPGSFLDEVKDATIDSETLDEPGEEVEMTTNDQPNSQTQDTLANDEVKDTDAAGDMLEASPANETGSKMPGGESTTDEITNIETVEAEEKTEEASIDDSVLGETIAQGGGEELVEGLPAETVLSDEPLMDDQSQPVAEDAALEFSSEEPKCVAEEDEKTLDLEPGKTAEEDEKKHRKNLIAAAAAGVAAAVTAHEAKKHRRKKDGHWEREPASPISTTKDSKHVLDRHKDDAKLFSSAFARQLDKAKEDRDRYHQSDEYKEKQRRRRERREKREAAEAEERRKERAFLRKQQELREVYDASMNKKTSELQRDAEDRRRKEFEKRQRNEEDRRMHRTTSHRPRAGSSRRSSAGSDGTRPAIMKRIATGESDTGGPLLKINMAKAGGYNIPSSAPASPPRSTKASAVDRANGCDSASGTDGGHRRHRHRRRHHSRHGTAEELFETTSRVNVDGKTVLSEKLVRRTTNNSAEFDEPPGRKLWRKVVNAIHQ